MKDVSIETIDNCLIMVRDKTLGEELGYWSMLVVPVFIQEADRETECSRSDEGT